MDWFHVAVAERAAATPDRPHNTTPEARSSKPVRPRRRSCAPENRPHQRNQQHEDELEDEGQSARGVRLTRPYAHARSVASRTAGIGSQAQRAIGPTRCGDDSTYIGGDPGSRPEARRLPACRTLNTTSTAYRTRVARSTSGRVVVLIARAWARASRVSVRRTIE